MAPLRVITEVGKDEAKDQDQVAEHKLWDRSDRRVEHAERKCRETKAVVFDVLVQTVKDDDIVRVKGDQGMDWIHERRHQQVRDENHR